MAASVGAAINPPHAEERAVFTQLKPVRMSAVDGAEDASVFEDVKPSVSPCQGPRRGRRSPPVERGSSELHLPVKVSGSPARTG